MVVRNALCVPSMNINLIPPFIMREAGLVLSTTPKIHCDDPTVEDHSMFDEETGLRIPFTLNGIFSVFESRSLNEDEIDNAENYQTVFLTPDSNVWDPYDQSYKENEDSNLDNRGRMVIPTTPTHHNLVGDADVSAAVMTDHNDVAMPATDSISQHNVSWKEDMLSKRKKIKIRERIQRIKASATFELSLAEAQLADFDSDEAACEAPPPIDWNMDHYLPGLPQPEEWAPLPELSQPQG